MSTLEVVGGAQLKGRIRVPGDKSISHRALLLAARARGTSRVVGLSDGDDVRRTAAAVQAMGARIEGDRITGGDLREPERVLNVGNSGTTIRLLTGYCAAFPWLTVLEGDASIASRPMDRVSDPLRAMGATIDGRAGGALTPLVVRGGALRGIDYTPPMASAQVKSALLLAGIGADGETVVREPVLTRAHTEEMLQMAGATVVVEDAGHTVRVRRSALQPFELSVPGDPSQAAFWAVAGLVVPGSDLLVDDIYVGPARVGFVDVLRRMGGAIDIEPTGPQQAHLRSRSSALHATVIDGSEIPSLDEVPILAVAATMADGETVIRNAAELRVKESDRIKTVTDGLRRLGADIDATDDGLVVRGPAKLVGAPVESYGDHRVAMAMAVAGLVAEGTTRIEGWDAVTTSYPTFAEDLQACRS